MPEPTSPDAAGAATAESQQFVTGDRLRRQVLGDSYVDSRPSEGPFADALTQFVTSHCWGNVWARPGLDLRTRSIVTLSVLAALGRSAEITVHTRGAIRNGLSAEEIAEVLLHVGVYAGVPAAVDAFRAAGGALPDPGQQ